MLAFNTFIGARRETGHARLGGLVVLLKRWGGFSSQQKLDMFSPQQTQTNDNQNNAAFKTPPTSPVAPVRPPLAPLRENSVSRPSQTSDGYWNTRFNLLNQN